MSLKEQVEKLKKLFDEQAVHAKQYLDLNEQIKKLQTEIKSTMDDEGLDSFECAIGELEITRKDTFVVPKEMKETMIQYFESDPTLAPLVKITKSVNYQTAQKVFRDMYNDENAVPEFVKVETYTELKPKFKDFKQQKEYLDKIKKKQKKESDSGDDAE